MGLILVEGGILIVPFFNMLIIRILGRPVNQMYACLKPTVLHVGWEPFKNRFA